MEHLPTATSRVKRNKPSIKERLQELFFNQARVGLVIGTAEGDLLEFMNPYFAAMHGYTVQELTGRPFADVLAPEYRAQLPAITEYIYQTGYYSYESKHIRKDGSIFPVLVTAYIVYDEENKAKYRVVNVVDLTELKRKEHKIQRLYNQASTLARTALTINAALDLDEVLETICFEVSTSLKASCVTIRLLDAKRQNYRLYYSYGKDPQFFTPSIPAALFERYFGGAEQVTVIEDMAAIEDPAFQKVFGHLNLKSLIGIKLYNGKEVSGAILLFRFGEEWPVTEEERMLMQGLAAQASLAIRNAQLYMEIKNNKQKLHQLHQQVVQTLEEERRRISWELHDELGQALTAIKIKLELVADTIYRNCLCRAELGKIITLVDDVVTMTRHIAYDLRPAALEAVGLIPALRNYCRTYTQRVGIPVIFTSSRDELPAISEAASITLYRVLQEGLTNAAKHSQATQIEVLLQTDAEFVSLIVQDNGSGPGPSELPPETGGGIGLLGMGERLSALGGTLKTKFLPGQGFTLTAQVPWEGRR
ncbi:PAS domain S-box protein [Hydrogenispora sp. UU3]|uniref:histidine kinase n=1 Tax=Capillibacterium thermochitinicola TaxID=2699427 RepID=A0A8J6HXZ4_9FIRM|nr:PAS domain S-box protein [Capillibacterium thermochitinicola]